MAGRRPIGVGAVGRQAALQLAAILMNAEKTGPLRSALFSIIMGAFSVPEMIHELSAAGFADIGHQALPEDLGTTLFTARRP